MNPTVYALIITFPLLLLLMVQETPKPEPLVNDVVYSEVLPIFKNRCHACHNTRGQDWTDYETAKKFRTQIKHRVWTTRSMPPNGDIKLSERELVRDWVDGGAKND